MTDLETVLKPIVFKELNIRETEDNPENWKVYIHISPSGKYYVGITSSSFKTRWKHGTNYKSCVAINRAIKKYGFDNFIHVEFATGLTESEAKNMEKLLIFKLHSNDSRYGYNLTEGGEGTLGMKMPQEAKERIILHHSKRIVEFDLQFNEKARYLNSVEAAKATGGNASAINACCNLKDGHITSGGSIWLFEDDLDKYSKEFILNRIRNSPIARPIIRYDKDGNEIKRYSTIIEAANDTGSHPGVIHGALTGINKTACESYWGYEGEPFVIPKKIKRFSKINKRTQDGALIKSLRGLDEAAKDANTYKAKMSKILRSKDHLFGDFLWILDEDDCFKSNDANVLAEAN